jgi:hypothetical protein
MCVSWKRVYIIGALVDTVQAVVFVMARIRQPRLHHLNLIWRKLKRLPFANANIQKTHLIAMVATKIFNRAVSIQQPVLGGNSAISLLLLSVLNTFQVNAYASVF